MFCVPHFQIATPPGFQVNYIPTRELCTLQYERVATEKQGDRIPRANIKSVAEQGMVLLMTDSNVRNCATRMQC